MNSDYINKVVSYIKNKRVKKEVEAELYDHIMLNDSFFKEIGYSEDDSILKVEERMGEAEIAGEQFAMIKNGVSVKDIILIVIGIGLVLFVDSVSYVFSISFGITYTSFLLLFSSLTINLIYLYFAAKRLNVFSVICGVAGVLVTSNVFEFAGFEAFNLSSFNPPMFIYDLLFSRSLKELLFGIGESDVIYFPLMNDINYVLAAVFVIIAIVTVILKIRIRILKNSKSDLTFRKVMRTFILCYTALICCVIAFNANGVTKQTQLFEEQREALLSCDTVIKKELNSCSQEEFERIYDIISEKPEQAYVQTLNELTQFDGYSSFSLFPKLIDINGKSVKLCTDSELKEAKLLAESKDFSIDKIKCPFSVSYEDDDVENKTKLYIIFTAKSHSHYDSDYSDYIVLNIENGKYTVDYSCFEGALVNKYSADISDSEGFAINNAIKKYAERPLVENISDRRDMYNFDGYPFSSSYREKGGLSLYDINNKFSELKIKSEIYFLDIHRVDNTDIYKADVILTYDVYTVNDSKLFDFGCVKAPFSYRFRLNGDTVEILDEWYPKNTSESLDEIKSRFSSIGYNRYLAYRNINTLIYSIQNEVGYTLYGSIVSVESDGTVKYKANGVNYDDEDDKTEYETTQFKKE